MTTLPVKPGIVTGLVFEAEIVRHAAPQQLVACHGPGLNQAEAAARDLIRQGADGLVSFGVAGALDPALRSATALIPARVLDESGAAHICSPIWRGAILAHAPALEGQGDLLSVASPVTGPADKAVLRERTGARAVDMESLAVARAAEAHGLPFIALRAVLDEAEDVIPATAMAGMRADGRTDMGATLAALARRPQDLPALVRLARANAAAGKTLARLAHLVA
ncbi:hypothetical protein [Rhodoligotrophos defluvii]|uniref:phosphorylase family protein n=1 Tax=Rhodoligotrophos defluvii TaxID=2561934 RepID=UPI0010C96B51|nr:hypothetical protein [Rhodoligotrophos defluvii]